MLQARGSPRRLPLSPTGLRVLQDAAPLEEGALDRLLSRAEFELADPEAIRRREIIAHLRQAAALTRAEHAWKALGIAWISSILRGLTEEAAQQVIRPRRQVARLRSRCVTLASWLHSGRTASSTGYGLNASLPSK